MVARSWTDPVSIRLYAVWREDRSEYGPATGSGDGWVDDDLTVQHHRPRSVARAEAMTS